MRSSDVKLQRCAFDTPLISMYKTSTAGICIDWYWYKTSMASSCTDGRQAREAIALAAYDFIIKHRVGENEPHRRAIKATPRHRGSARRRHHATTAPKDFGNAGPPTRGESPIRCTGKRAFCRGIASTATSWRPDGGAPKQCSIKVRLGNLHVYRQAAC